MSQSGKDEKYDDALDALSSMAEGKGVSEQPSEGAQPARPRPQPPAEQDKGEQQQPQQPRRTRPAAPTPPETPAEQEQARQAPIPKVPSRPVQAAPAKARAVRAGAARGKAARTRSVKGRTGRGRAAARQRHDYGPPKGYNTKQTMIPILITLGVMLLILCTVAAFRLPSEEELGDEGALPADVGSFLFKPWAKWVILAGFVVGVGLELGAFVFITQVRKYTPEPEKHR